MTEAPSVAVDRPPLNDPDSCYHEAGHCAAFWHYGVPIDCVVMRPGAETGHRAHTILVMPRVPPEGDRLDVEMRCAAAGEIAQRRYRGREPLTDGQLLAEFKWNERWALENIDADSAPTDGTIFALAAVLRDQELTAAGAVSSVGYPRWSLVWREAERLVGELWPAVTAIAAELIVRVSKVPGAEIVALAGGALNSEESRLRPPRFRPLSRPGFVRVSVHLERGE